MFKKFTDRVSSAANTAGNAIANPGSLFGDDDKVRRLQGMGFGAEEARNALNATDGDVDRAAELLIASGGTAQRQQQHTPAATRASPSNRNGAGAGATLDDQMRRAMEESVRAEEERQLREAKEASAPKGRVAQTAAAARAGKAAMDRAEASAGRYGNGARAKKGGKKAQKQPPPPNKTTTVKDPHPGANQAKPSGGAVRSKSGGLSHHPAVKLPGHLKDKTKEEQILRCADRLVSHPAAVDTLHRAFVALRSDPSNPKYRKIDKSTPGYQRTLEGVPGAEGMLHAMNFRTRGAYELVIDRAMVDDALLYLGISALEGAKESEEYKHAKRQAAFVKEIKAIQLGGNDSEAEAVRRAGFMAKCPSEPQGGSGALMQLKIGDDTVRRRFDGDDVLKDVLNWIGGHGSVIPDKIRTREWCLVDLNRYPIAPIDCTMNEERTLQYIGCWPSGRLEIRPSTEKWRLKGNTGSVVMGSSRGLGAAPTSTLH